MFSIVGFARVIAVAVYQCQSRSYEPRPARGSTSGPDPSLSSANGGLMATGRQIYAYHLTHWGARGLGSILRAIHRKGRHRDIALGLVCASLRDHLWVCVH